MVEPFNNPEVVVQSWYVAALSREIRRGEVVSKRLLGRQMAIYRGCSDQVSVLEARCAHLGADLGRGCVVGDQLRCSFHHWTYGGDGRCVDIPYMRTIPATARTFAYPVEEKYGAAWIFNGPKPTFPIPSFAQTREEELHVVHLRRQILNCHPHLAACNGLDIQHFRTVHQFEFAEDPVVEVPDPFQIQIKLRIRLRGHSFFQRGLRLLAGEILTATFTTWGGNMAQIDGRAGPVAVRVLFTHRPVEGNRSASQTFFFIPKSRGIQRLLKSHLYVAAAVRLIMGYILVGDRKILDTIQFHPNLVEADAPLAAFILQVNRMEVFHPSDAQRVIGSDSLQGRTTSVPVVRGMEQNA